jgi:DNA-binding NtrC family response regulator
MTANSHHSDRFPPRDEPVLILSLDAVAAALLGGLVETLGYDVHFARPPESADASLRRVRPRICLVDCTDPVSSQGDFLGRATMRRVSVIIFGTREALDRVRAVALTHNIGTLLMPPELNALEAALQRAAS